ncbi:Gfo/Idh/MocA family protein [Oceanobacillus bengalensis]|uniref:Gfo/Idh/MocA family oxidoreductase n=1 Tax=Oceanobacillus bengalensis TaxID=1435466 RepID=A0A494YZU7_9BACI|nr:Gfo/Idh/MocA family oxidoreductase [Oceanobacillus bengalensis]RKQ15694.1 gfo/Idh/MocA family oxidoreductase [Oceanobacillus bengalensis]
MKIGIISFAHMHALSYATYLLQHPEAELVGIWDAEKKRGKEMAQKFDTNFYLDLDEFLQTDVEAVIVCSENVNHKEHVIKAARYRKHILCEKPIATEVEDAKAMIEACEKSEVILQVAYPVRFVPAIQQVKQMIESGQIGEVVAVNATNHGQMPGGWFVEKELSGGGSATDHIVHIMDLLRWILKDEVKNVYAELDTRFYDIDVEDCGSVLLELESGVIASIDPSWSRPATFPTWGDVTMKIVGTEGTIAVDAYKQYSLLYNDKDGRIQQKPWADDMDEGLVNDFIDCIKTRREPFITGTDGLRTLEVVKAAYMSNELKRTVTIER